MERKILIIIIVVVIVAVTLGLYFLFAGPSQNSGPLGNQNGNLNSGTSGLKVEISGQGTGAEAKTGDTVTVHYVGSILNGKKFDSSVDRNAPFTFTIGKEMTIKGFELGVLGMKAGEKRKLTIPPELGYGSTAFTLIPANSTLVYDVEMLGIR